MMKRCNRKLFLILLTFSGFSSCGAYFVDPVATPVFTAPWQGNVQINTTTDKKFYFEGAASLPFNLALVASRGFWGHNLINDQEMTSIALGKFWPINNISLLALGGVGEGSQRTGPGYLTHTFENIYDLLLLDGNSDFRKYFIEFEFARSDSIQLKWFPGLSETNSYGIATRLEYLNLYRFNQTTKEWSDAPTAHPNDTTYSIDNAPEHALGLDLVAFVSVGISFVQLYEQFLVRLPISGYVNMDGLVSTAGLRIAF
jgi:hypothetical protein